MKDWKELNLSKQFIAVALLVLIISLFICAFIEITDKDNWSVIINCSGKEQTFNLNQKFEIEQFKEKNCPKDISFTGIDLNYSYINFEK